MGIEAAGKALACEGAVGGAAVAGPFNALGATGAQLRH